MKCQHCQEQEATDSLQGKNLCSYCWEGHIDGIEDVRRNGWPGEE